MSQTIKPKAKKRENWLQAAFNNCKKGEVNAKIAIILDKCEISLNTFYRWKASGFVPKQRDVLIICEILNINPETKK
ncbi:MAG: hypothetical protein K0R26_1937 [Bacteroidota bacterium]|jgi:hypothetical protein|nr:hypothetical protein [Bacteroidota bacterium]